MQSYLSDFTVIRPRYEKNQRSILHWIAGAHSRWLENEPEPKAMLLEDLKKIERGTKKIQTRGTQLPDLEHEDWQSMSIFRLDKHPRGLGLKERTTFFSKEVTELFEQFYPEKKELPHHLIHVTCTGYASPSGAQKIVSLRGSRKTQVTHAYHMGCYGAFPAIQMGTGFLMSSSENLFVDVVHTELCSLHINPSLHTKGQLVIESLFADGFIKYRVQKQRSSSCFRILSFLEEIVPDSIQDMSWACTDSCFEMFISKEVPFKIGQELKSFLERLSKKAKVSFEELLKKAVFAIHPGGPKIIEQVSRQLDLETSQTEHSFEILKSCGNMSSATIPHIWQKILSDPKVPKDTFVVSVAFGPGLTFAGSILQKQG
jgi:predicted naringenin-chalcone synthase